MVTYKVYCITNLVNNKKYIGITRRTNVKLRIDEHRRGQYDNIISRAIKKHGWDNFSWNILEETDCMKKAVSLECSYIEALNTYYVTGHGYNMTHGGDHGSWTYNMTEDHKRNIQKALTGRKPSPESMQKAKKTREINKKPAWNKGKKLDQDQRKNMGPKKGRVPWNKGLTKEDPRVKANSDAWYESRKNGSGWIPWNKKKSLIFHSPFTAFGSIIFGCPS
jgi:group I intron endonuclease